MNDDFQKELYEWVSGKRAQLRGKRIPVLLTVEDMELIEWSLDAFAKKFIIETLNLEAENLSAEAESTSLRQQYERIKSKLDAQFEDAKRKQATIEMVLARLNEAVDDELERRQGDKNQPGLDFNSN